MQKIDQKTFKIIGFPDQHPFPTISAMIMRTYAPTFELTIPLSPMV